MDNDCKVSRWAILKNRLNNLTPEEFKSFAEKKKDAIIIDCRTTEEFRTGKLFNAVHFDYFDYDFIDRMEALDSEKIYLIYCRSGRRSLRTCTLFRNGGFKNIYNLSGGLNAWSAVYGLEGVS